MRIPTPEEMLKSRTALGLSQQEVADLVGVSQKAYSLWESGANKPKSTSTIKLLKVLKLNLEDSEAPGSESEAQPEGEIAALKKIIQLLEAEKLRLTTENEELKRELKANSRRYFSELELSLVNESSAIPERGKRFCSPALFNFRPKVAPHKASRARH